MNNLSNNIGENQPLEVTVYPNPVNDLLFVTGLDLGSTLMFYDVKGELSKTEKVKGVNTGVFMDDLSVGIYFLRVKDSQGWTQTIKIINKEG